MATADFKKAWPSGISHRKIRPFLRFYSTYSKDFCFSIYALGVLFDTLRLTRMNTWSSASWALRITSHDQVVSCHPSCLTTQNAKKPLSCNLNLTSYKNWRCLLCHKVHQKLASTPPPRWDEMDWGGFLPVSSWQTIRANNLPNVVTHPKNPTTAQPPPPPPPTKFNC